MEKYKIWVLFSALFMTGVFAGCLISGLTPLQLCLDAVKPFNTAPCGTKMQVFTSAFYFASKPLVFVFLLALTKASFYFNGTLLLYRGALLGFISSALLRVYGTKSGILLVLAGILPHYTVYIPLILYVCTYTFIYSKNRRAFRRMQVISFLAVTLICLIFYSLCDSLITYELLKRGIEGVT